MNSYNLNVIASETGHLYYQCHTCGSKTITETGWTFYCDDCNDYVSVQLKGEQL